MEPLSRKTQIAAEYLLTFFYFLLVLVPVFQALLSYSFDLSADYLSPLFFFLLFKSAAFALLQATLSVFAVALFVFIVASLRLYWPAALPIKKVFEAVGILSFSLSPTLVTLALLMSFGSLFNVMPSGLWAIVFCHFLMNAAFFSSFFQRRLNRFFSQYGNELRSVPDSLGASRIQKILLLIWPVFKVDFKSWAPQVFLWSFMSFSPVVLLAASTQQSTPEVLLYYSLLNDPSGSRMLIIFLFTATISFFLQRSLFKSRKKELLQESHSLEKGVPSFVLSSVLLVLVTLFLFFPFLYSLLSPLFYGSAIQLSELQPALLPTFIVFSSSFLIALLAGVLSLLCGKELKIISYCNFISSPMILAGALRYASDIRSLYAFPLIALGAFLAVLPWFHRQVASVAERLSSELKLLSLTLGMTGFSYFKYFLWPQVGPTILRFSLLVSLWSLGEYTFSKALLNRSSTLALMVDENLRRYHFAEASAALSLTLLTSAIVVTIVLWKGERRAAV